VPPGPKSAPVADETRALARPGGRPPLGAIVRPVGAKASPAALRLAPGAGPWVIGAGAGAAMIVQSDTVSRAHLELALVPEGVLATDLGSRNGSFYLGQRFERMVIALGSVARLGTVDVRVDADLDALDAAQGEAAPQGYRGLLGTSAPMRRLFAVLARLEGSLASVLVEGESGTGKELVARAIHAGSSVSAGPFVVVNCGAIARELVLSELFGHRRGAFTGATGDRVGAFEAAHGGTIFLDEIGELPIDVQPALLRALEAGEVRPVGETAARSVRVRVVAATNRRLEEEVRAGRFREDLYYRLAVVRLATPPLRDRPEDVPLFADHFARLAGAGALPEEARAAFAARSWPGNLRELRNAVQAFLAIGALPGDASAEGSALEAALRRAIDPRRPYEDVKEEVMGRFWRVYLEVLLRETNGNQSEAARVSGLDRSYLGRMIARYGVR
jgi:DNA-binding NtrC family response regulator